MTNVAQGAMGEFIAVLTSAIALILVITFAFEGKAERLTGPATLALAAVTLGLAFVSYTTLIELREGARAFVGLSVRLTTIRDPANNNVDVWRVVVSLENTGNSPAQNVHWIYSGGIDFTPDREHTEITVTPLNSSAEGHGVILPKSNNPIIDNIITRPNIVTILQGRGSFYLGLVRYDDTFGQPHVTKFCVHIYGGPWFSSMSQTALGLIIDRLEPAFNMCRVNNCADEQCTLEHRRG
jgi:hypothetical protein